jgi:hypothetical protein
MATSTAYFEKHLHLPDDAWRLAPSASKRRCSHGGKMQAEDEMITSAATHGGGCPRFDFLPGSWGRLAGGTRTER